MGQMKTLWASRSRREQIMLAGLGGLLLVVAGWYGVVQPLGRWQADTAFERQVAEVRLSRTGRQIADGRAYGASEQAVREVLEQAARQADVQVRLTSQGDNLAFELDRVPSKQGLAFLLHLEQQRLSPESLRIDVLSNGTLQIVGRTG